ncbi:MAG TPA: c-type cytochrome [Vicinamibacterales bacterium]|jgi:mono/diheme cytochrome c family protein|nr:c-type cytochrome [Vicinamibacterales bacterium]
MRRAFAFILAMVSLGSLTAVAGQPQPPPAQGGRGGGRGGGAGPAAAFPQRPPADPALVERGKGIYSVNCQFCHGADTRGGDSGPSLLRSQLVQDDQRGERIAEVVQNGRPPRMPKFTLTIDQMADLAAFLHSFTINSRDPARMRPASIVTGDAEAGQRYFAAHCASCHSPAGDLKGIASRIADPRALQQWWLLPGGVGPGRGGAPPPGVVPPMTATVTLPSGEKLEGRLVRIDEFTVSVMEADGTTRTFRRDGETPNVDVHDALKPHRDLLRAYTDKDIHDVTAYLVKLK